MKRFRFGPPAAIVAAAIFSTVSISAVGARAAFATSGAPLASGAYTFDTTLTARYTGGGSYEGVLKLNVSDDGTLAGLFRYTDVGTFRTVVGGVNGTNVWLDLGTGVPGRLTSARFEDGKIVGSVYFDGQPYDFVATQAAE